MMRTLAIDTSTSQTSVTLFAGENVVSTATHIDSLAHGEVLPVLVQQLLAESGSVDQVVVGMGPGPFTGLRVGIAFAQSFALARAIPWIGICSLDAIVQHSGDYLVATDARRKEVFWARYNDGIRVDGPHVSSPRTLPLLRLPIFGEGGVKYGMTTSEINVYPDTEKFLRLLPRVTHYKSPIYIRRPDAYPAPAGVTFRPMLDSDLNKVATLERSVFQSEAWSLDQLSDELNGIHREYIVAIKELKIIGYGGVNHLGEVSDITTISVLPEFRRQGIAREMLRRLIDLARVKKAEAIMLEVRVGNEPALELYKDFGFVELGIRRNYYGPGINAVNMRKDLR